MEFFRSNSNGKHSNLGNCSMSLGQLKSCQGNFATPIKNKGNLQIKNIKVERRHSFLEYVFGGCDIDLSIAIDFTLSNRPPNDPSSLHFFDPKKNQYLQVIQSVGGILQYYNSNKFINLYGFGGAVPPFG